MVALDFIIRSDCVVILIIPPNASGVPSAFRPRLLPLLHSYFFRGGDLNWNGVAKRRGGRPVRKQEAVGMKCKCQWCLRSYRYGMRPAHGSILGIRLGHFRYGYTRLDV